MAISTFSELKTAVSAWLHRPDLTTQINDMITIAEQDIFRELRVRQMETRTTLSVTAGNRYTSLPSAFLELRRIYFDTNPKVTPEMVSMVDMQERADAASTGTPEHYTIIGSEIEWDALPSSSFSAPIVYYAKPTGLSDSNTSNTILTNYPDIYLFGTLKQAQSFIEEDNRIAVWENQYISALSRANAKSNKARYSGNLITMRADVAHG